MRYSDGIRKLAKKRVFPDKLDHWPEAAIDRRADSAFSGFPASLFDLGQQIDVVG